MKRVKKYLLLVSFFTMAFAAAGQSNLPFWNEVQMFKKQDSTAFPAEKQILFIGSSSFTMWRDVNDYFPGYKILNRAFGGSSLPDVMRYRYEVVYPYRPRQIVMYCGENDFGGNPNLSPDNVAQRFIALFKQIRNVYPAVPFAYVSMKPSPSRAHLMLKFEKTNSLIKQFLAKQKNARFIDIYHAMLDAAGNPRPELFLGDKLHMKPEGYKIWQKIMRPYLVK